MSCSLWMGTRLWPCAAACQVLPHTLPSVQPMVQYRGLTVVDCSLLPGWCKLLAAVVCAYHSL